MQEALIEKLEAFGLSAKEANLYSLLLKYGPKTTGELAKLLHSYRVDVYRILETLGEKGMVEESVEKPTRYAAVPAEPALEAAMMRHAYELRWMEENRDGVLKLANEYLASEVLANDLHTFKVIKGRSNTLAAMEQLVKIAEERIAVISPLGGISILSGSGLLERFIDATNRGVRVRYVTEILLRNIDSTRDALAGGIEVRHYEDYAGVRFLVADARESLTTITFDSRRHGREAADTAFWTNSAEYAQYLEASFELLWDNSVDAVKRIDHVLADAQKIRQGTAKNSS
ncbi:MAG TPA: helix-turn-helix domain-containing protein [Candidatus Bathyarchaeia archaeon]|nr:helix-turn-helix domain-containing protein [Candidatus Bathyarchaeia archaeon]